MFEILNNWFEALRFSTEAQSVVWLRLILLANGHERSADEAMQMVSEKFIAFAQAELAAAGALAHGRSLYVAAAEAYQPLRSRVHANSQRLIHLRRFQPV